MSQLPEGQLARMGIVGSTAVRLGAREIKRRATNPFKPHEDRESASELLDEQQAVLLFQALTKLKGTAIKLAQMLSMETDLLPEKYRRELEKSYHQVPPLNRVLVNKVFRQEFNALPDQLFKSFESTAFAAASLGQVHRAVIDDGTEVAVKIQYPGIHVAMDSDIKLLRKLAHTLPNKNIIYESIDEIHARLREELDYTAEAQTTHWFGSSTPLPGIEIPAVKNDWCSKRIITTQLLDGKHLDAWLAENPPQETRNRVAQQLYDLFIHSTLTLKCLHADPNPGNYLFRDDGTIGLIDFGCTRTFSNRFTSNLRSLLQAFEAADKAAVFSAYESIGMRFGRNSDDLFEEAIKPFGQWVSMPFKQDSFDFKRHKNYTNSGRDLIHRIASISDIDTMAEEFIFFDRTIYGLCKIFEKLEATVSMRQHWFQ